MTDIIVIVIIAIAAGFGVHSTMKHFKGQSGCCGGSTYKPKKKKLTNVLYKKIFYVDGMHCENCQNRVQEAVNDIAGIAGIVNLKKGIVTVSYAESVEDETIKAKIERAGYTVTKIESK